MGQSKSPPWVKIVSAPTKETQLALWISLGTLCRIGELLQAKWKNVDLDRQTWFLPSENVKGSRGKKQDHRKCFALRPLATLGTSAGVSV